MKCPECGFEDLAGMRFCGQCGTSNPPQSKFCGECGHNLTSREISARPKVLSLDDKLLTLQRYLKMYPKNWSQH